MKNVYHEFVDMHGTIKIIISRLDPKMLDRRGQSYDNADNANNMSGKYKGLHNLLQKGYSKENWTFQQFARLI